MKALYFSIILLFANLSSNAQGILHTQGGAIFSPATDTLPASALLTSPAQFSYGAVYLGSQQNLNQALTYEFDIMLGHSDQGADGMVFMLHNDPRGQLAHGDVGMGLGYAYSPNAQDHMNSNSSQVTNSIAIEFDTYQNSSKSDPAEDHVALVTNGNNKHSDFPSTYLKKLSNIEDGQFHRFRFEWDPTQNRIRVLLDQVLKLDINIDIRNIIGGSVAYIGFSATTGAMVNEQMVRDVSSPLPVALYSFDAFFDEDTQTTIIDWTTLSETNNHYFEIEKSFDGRSFETIATVNGAGNSNAPIQYQFVDKTPDAPVLYYRLKQVDYDGANETFQHVIVYTSHSNNEIDMNAYANDGRIIIDFFNPEVYSTFQFSVFDLTGKMINSSEDMFEKGFNRHTINIDQPSGAIVFLMMVNTTGIQKTHAVLIP